MIICEILHADAQQVLRFSLQELPLAVVAQVRQLARRRRHHLALLQPRLTLVARLPLALHELQELLVLGLFLRGPQGLLCLVGRVDTCSASVHMSCDEFRMLGRVLKFHLKWLCALQK